MQSVTQDRGDWTGGQGAIRRPVYVDAKGQGPHGQAAGAILIDIMKGAADGSKLLYLDD